MLTPPRSFLCLLSILAGPLLLAEDKGPQTVEELRQAVEIVLKEGHTPGAAVAIVSRDKVEWIAGLGLADEAANKPVTTKTIFRIGSASKEFVALAALKLQEEGKLKLTDTLRQWVPEFPVENAWESTDPVRLDQLLEHTSGIPDLRFSEYAHNDPSPVTLTQALNFAPQNRVIRWRPGSRYAYSGVGPALVAAVVEKISGLRFEDYVRDNFFGPLRMDTTSYFLTPEVESNLTTMYWSRSHKVAPYQHVIYRPSGAINASIEDMASYVRFHLQRGSLDGQRILKEASIDRLELPTTLPAARAGVTVGYGLCNWSMFSAGYKWHGHGGNRDACFVTMEYCPELGVGLVVMLNSNQEDALARTINLMRGYVMRKAPQKVFPPAGPMPAFFNQEFEGTYHNIAPRDEGYTDFIEGLRSFRKIRVDEKGMTMTRVPSRWVPVSGNLFRLEDGTEPELAVITGEGGEMLLQCFQGTFRHTSEMGLAALNYGMKFSFGILLSAVLFAMIWGGCLAFGRLKNAGPLGLRSWPLLGVAGVGGFIAFYVNFQEGHIDIVGTMNVWSVGLMLGTLLIPLSAIFTAVGLWRHRKTPMNRFAYWHAVLVALGLLFITGYGLAWGLIGIRTWA
jgi:CubicO group peptidase (beta-lactamase class C family)